jgi:hypothetical protein
MQYGTDGPTAPFTTSGKLIPGITISSDISVLLAAQVSLRTHAVPVAKRESGNAVEVAAYYQQG